MIILSLRTAYSEMVQVKSKITDVSTLSNYLKVDRLDPRTGKIEEIKINVHRSTHFEGFRSLRDLSIGDEISVEADYNAYTHEWKARAIGPYNQK